MGSLLDLIPHRPPWRLVDRLLDVGGDWVRAEKLVAADDPLLAGDELAELLVVEALAQTAAALNAATGGAHQGLLVAARGFSFTRRARVGERVTLSARRTARLGQLVRFDTEAAVDDVLLTRGELTFAVEGVGHGAEPA